MYFSAFALVVVSNGAVDVTFAKNADHDIATYMLVYPQVYFRGDKGCYAACDTLVKDGEVCY